jgi:hypothetical protein
MSSQSQPSREQRRAQHNADQERLPTILLQHWATMVSEQGEQLEEYREQLRTVVDRSLRTHRDNAVMQEIIDRTVVEIAALERLSVQMGNLVLQILRENPTIQVEQYEQTYYNAINQWNEINPIDLTAREELNEAIFDNTFIM